MPIPRLIRLGVTALALVATTVHAHDPSAYGGLFRTRDFGATWLNADVGLFLGAAVSLAIDPRDPNHLLLGSDAGLLASRNGGRAWVPQASGRLFGAVFAVIFLADGSAAVCATPVGVFHLDGDEWQQAAAPVEAAPARAIVLGGAPGRLYLLGRRALYRSDDGGHRFARVEHDLADEPEFTALAVTTQPAETLYAIVDGALFASVDGGRSWRPRANGLPTQRLEALSLDSAVGARLWVASTGRIYATEDGGLSWRPVGQPLPEADTSVRAIAADRAGAVLVVTTHRGVYRSIDRGGNWALLEGNLPVHLEARPLVPDPNAPGTLYAGYSLIPYSELWRRSLEGGNLLSRVAPASLAGGVAFLMLLVIGGVFTARWLLRRRSVVSTPVRGS